MSAEALPRGGADEPDQRRTGGDGGSPVGGDAPSWRSALPRLRSPLAATAFLVAIDLASRAGWLAPRLVTLRGAINYAAAVLALGLTLRLLAALGPRARVIPYVLLVAFPMTLEWGMFRSFGQFLETSDFFAAVVSPRVTLRAVGAGGDRLGGLVVFLLSLGGLALLGARRRPLGRWRAIVAAVVLAAILGTGATYWRASPSLEHPQPAFGAALLGTLRRAAARTRSQHLVAIPASLPSAFGQAGERRPNIVLVLGESLAASHLTLYGYDKPTSPRLEQLARAGQLVVLEDAVVMGPHTRTSVPYIMTGLSGPDPKGRVFGAPSMLEYAKARGYTTAFVSAQEESWGDLDAILRRGADTFQTGIHFAPDVDVVKGCDDLVLLERGVLPALSTLPQPFLLVVHMDGSHAPYAHHSPKTHKVFPEDGVNSIGAYDNTIRVTDAFVAKVFEALRQRDPNAWFFFTSDHGQALGEGGAFFHRGYQSNVFRDPLLVGPPDPAAAERWRGLARRPTAACDLAPTILHLTGARPASGAEMDCVDLEGDPGPTANALATRTRVVSAYTPAFLAEPTMLLLFPDGRRGLYDLWRETVVLDDGTLRPMREIALPDDVARRLR